MPVTLHATLPVDRLTYGRFWVESDGGRPIEPAPCFGKSDTHAALAHDNSTHDPTRPYGDHPFGRYRVLDIIEGKPPMSTYGIAFILLEPLEGECLIAKVQGLRLGLALHGGDLSPGGYLRPTYGCNRLHNETVRRLISLPIFGAIYTCERA